MSCKICGRGACASWMHSSEDIEKYESIEKMSESQMVREIISLREEIEVLKQEICSLKHDD